MVRNYQYGNRIYGDAIMHINPVIVGIMQYFANIYAIKLAQITLHNFSALFQYEFAKR